MKKKKRPCFPKVFFQQPRPEISNAEAFKDVIPIKWPKEVLEGKRKVFFVSREEAEKLK